MIALTYHSPLAKHFRGRLTSLTTEELARCAADGTLKQLDGGGLGDGRLVFHDSAAPAFGGTCGSDGTADHGVVRNARFVSDPLVANHFLDAHLIGGARICHFVTPDANAARL